MAERMLESCVLKCKADISLRANCIRHCGQPTFGLQRGPRLVCGWITPCPRRKARVCRLCINASDLLKVGLCLFRVEWNRGNERRGQPKSKPHSRLCRHEVAQMQGCSISASDLQTSSKASMACFAFRALSPVKRSGGAKVSDFAGQEGFILKFAGKLLRKQP